MIKRELDRITSNPRPSIESWVYHPENHPFGDDITGPEAKKLSLDDVRSRLSSQLNRNSLSDHNSSNRDINSPTDKNANSPTDKNANSSNRDSSTLDISIQ